MVSSISTYTRLIVKHVFAHLLFSVSFIFKLMNPPVRLEEALAEDVLKLLHNVIHVDGDQTAVLL